MATLSFDDLIPQQQGAQPPPSGGLSFDDLIPQRGITPASGPSAAPPANPNPGVVSSGKGSVQQTDVATPLRQPIGRIDRASEVQGEYVTASGERRVVNPRTDMVDAEGNVFAREGNQPGDVVNRGTILPFVETIGPDGRPQQGLGLPGIIHGATSAADRLLTEPVQPGSSASGATDALQAGAIGMGGVQGAFGPVPNILPRATPRAVTEAVTPPPVAPQQNIAEMAAQAGVEIPRAAAGNLATQQVAGTLRELPFVGAPLVRAANRATQQMDDAVQGTANALGASSREGAGLAARDSLVDWMQTRSNQTIDDAYRALDDLINPGAMVPLSRTQAAAKALQERDIISASADGQSVIRLVQEAVARRGMTYEGIRELRTRIGNRLSGDITEHGVSNTALRRLYASLSEDLEFSVARGGVAGGGKDRALAAFRTANETARTVFGQREALAKIIGRNADANGEAIVDRIRSMAGAARGGDIARIQLARQSMDAAAWDDIAGAIVRNMGQTKDGWSLARWRTDYGKLSDAGRSALFGSGKDSHRASLDRIFALGRFAEQLQRLGNPSQSGRFAALVTAPTAFFAAPGSLLTTIFGGRILSHILAKPITAKAAADVAKATRDLHRAPHSEARYAALIAAVRALATASGEDPDAAQDRLVSIAPPPQKDQSRVTEAQVDVPTLARPPANAMAGSASFNAMRGF